MRTRKNQSGIGGKKNENLTKNFEKLCEKLNIGNKKAVKIFAELDEEKGIGLISRKKQGQGKPTKIYVMNFTKFIENSDFNDDQGQTSENQKSPYIVNLIE